MEASNIEVLGSVLYTNYYRYFIYFSQFYCIGSYDRSHRTIQELG